MAGILEQLQQHMEQNTAALSKLRDQLQQHMEENSDPLKGLKAGSLTKSTDALDTKNSHCNEKPVRESGYVNWDESHDSLKNSKNMRWINVRSLYFVGNYDPETYLRRVDDRCITVNEDTRFPEVEEPQDNLYVNTSHPEVICELLNYGNGESNKKILLSWIKLVKNHLHTRTSFEEKYKLRWVDPKEQTPFEETESEIPKIEGSAAESPKSFEIKDTEQKIAENEKDQQILGKVITNNVDTLTNNESMPIINSGEKCDSNENHCSKLKTSKVYDNTQIILTEENPATTVDITSIEAISSQKLPDTADVLTENTGGDLIMPLNSIIDSLLKQDSSVSLTAPEDEADGAEEHLSENEFNTELKHEDEEDNKSLELLEMLPEMLDIITQSKTNNLITELSALDLSHKKPLNIVVELFVDNYSDIMEELIKKKINKFLQEVKAFNMSSKEHFNILIDVLCEKIAEEPDLAHHFADMCHELSKELRAPLELSTAKEFRSLLIHKCQNDFETFVLDTNQKIDEEDHQMNRRCVGIVRFIGELYNKDMLTTRILDDCLAKLLETSKEINLECVCELLNTSGIKIQRESFTELSKILKKIDELLSSEPNSDNISCRVKRMMQNTLDLSKRKWKAIPLPKTLDQFEKKADRKRLLINMLKGSEMEDRKNTRIGSPVWFDEDRVEFKSKPEKINGDPSRTKYSVETLKLAVTNENISYIKEPPTYLENINENYSILEKFQADSTTHNDRILSYHQETILSHVDNKDSTTLTQDNLSQIQYKIARHLIQGYIETSDTEKLALDIESQIPRRNRGALMDLIVDEALTSQHTTILSNAMFLLVETNIVALDIFKAAIKEIFYTLHILYKHIPFPELFEKLTCILAPHIENHNITLADVFVMSNNIIIVKEGHHFLGTLLLTLKERKGEAFVKTLWVDSKLSPVQWMFTEMVPQWVADYKLAFLNPHLFNHYRPPHVPTQNLKR